MGFFKFILWNVLVLVIVFEILSRFFLSNYMDSKLSKIARRYQFDNIFDDVTDSTISEKLQFFDSLVKTPHPYLGYVRLDSDLHFDIIHETQKSHDFMAIFGGSVAESFYHYNMRENLLQTELKKNLDLKNYPGIRNYALGGYKQPQQLIATVLFRPNVKITVNIEGANEFTPLEKFPHYYPSPSESNLNYSGVESWDLYVKAGKIRAYQGKLKEFMEKNWWLESISVFFKILYFFKEKSIISLEQKLVHQKEKRKGSFAYISPFEKMIYWFERSCEQQNFLADRGVKSYFFFQPMPFLPESKKLTTREKKMLEDENWMEGHGNKVETYLLVRKTIKKGNLSLNLVDMSQIFLNETREVFSDGYCHLNDLGRSLLTQEIVKVIKKTYSESEKPKPCRDDFRSIVEKFR